MSSRGFKLSLSNSISVNRYVGTTSHLFSILITAEVYACEGSMER